MSEVVSQVPEWFSAGLHEADYTPRQLIREYVDAHPDDAPGDVDWSSRYKVAAVVLPTGKLKLTYVYDPGVVTTDTVDAFAGKVYVERPDENGTFMPAWSIEQRSRGEVILMDGIAERELDENEKLDLLDVLADPAAKESLLKKVLRISFSESRKRSIAGMAGGGIKPQGVVKVIPRMPRKAN